MGGGGGGTREIKVRLRPARDPSSFYPYESLLGTMLHELTHNIRWEGARALRASVLTCCFRCRSGCKKACMTFFPPASFCCMPLAVAQSLSITIMLSLSCQGPP